MTRPVPDYRYVDTTTDYQGRTWFVNDRIAHVIPGVRTDPGTIAIIHGPTRVTVKFDDGAWSCAVYLSECILLRRRTLDETPMAAREVT